MMINSLGIWPGCISNKISALFSLSTSTAVNIASANFANSCSILLHFTRDAAPSLPLEVYLSSANGNLLYKEQGNSILAFSDGVNVTRIATLGENNYIVIAYAGGVVNLYYSDDGVIWRQSVGRFSGSLGLAATVELCKTLSTAIYTCNFKTLDYIVTPKTRAVVNVFATFALLSANASINNAAFALDTGAYYAYISGAWTVSPDPLLMVYYGSVSAEAFKNYAPTTRKIIYYQI
jgi:hypothetical protein